MGNFTSILALGGLIIFYLVTAQSVKAEFKPLVFSDYPIPEAKFRAFELNVQSFPTATPSAPLNTTPNSTASELPPASSPPPKPFPIEIVYAAIAIASAITIIIITGIVLKKKLQ